MAKKGPGVGLKVEPGRLAIVFGVLLKDADEPWPGRNQLMMAMAETFPVILLQSRSTGVRPHLRRGDGVYVMENAFALRSTHHCALRRMARFLAVIDGYWFRRELTRSGFSDFVYWLTVADRKLSYGIPVSKLVYDCMDPNFIPERQREFDREELFIAGRAQVVFASAQTLLSRMRATNEHAYLLPNASGRRSRRGVTGVLPPGLKTCSRPLIGYLGTVDWRFDPQVVAVAAEEHPGMTFAIAGRVNADQEPRLTRLRRLPNVMFLGPLTEAEGVAFVESLDVAIIPFEPGATSDAINPVKMFMYLAAGKPVVSTWIAECVNAPHVAAARTTGEFAAAVGAAASSPQEGAAQRRAYAASNTWDDRAAEALRILNEHGLVPPPAGGSRSQSALAG
jgi:glycosyltransferase involved in cell wall biosynthesis